MGTEYTFDPFSGELPVFFESAIQMAKHIAAHIDSDLLIDDEVHGIIAFKPDKQLLGYKVFARRSEHEAGIPQPDNLKDMREYLKQHQATHWMILHNHNVGGELHPGRGDQQTAAMASITAQQTGLHFHGMLIFDVTSKQAAILEAVVISEDGGRSFNGAQIAQMSPETRHGLMRTVGKRIGISETAMDDFINSLDENGQATPATLDAAEALIDEAERLSTPNEYNRALIETLRAGVARTAERIGRSTPTSNPFKLPPLTPPSDGRIH